MLTGAGQGTIVGGTGGGGSAAATAADTTPLLFATALLTAMGWPTTQSNIAAMVSWEQAEGGNWENPDAYNPLDTTMPEPGAVSTNGPGVKKYTSWAQGLQATVATLQLSYYPAIRAAFAGGNASQTLVPTASGELRTWGTNPAAIQAGISSGSWQKYATRTGGSGIGGPGLSTGSGSSSSSASSGCAFGVGPFCIFSEAGLYRFYGALLILGGGLVLTVGLGLVVVGALAETKLGRATSKTFGSAGLGAVVGAAAAPGRAVSGQRQASRQRREQATQAQARQARQAAQESHQAALRRAQLRAARARARRQEEGVRTQRAITQGRQDSATISDYERTEGARRRREAVESRRAGRSLAAQNRRRIQQRQKFEDVFGEAS
ncbi:MAG: hypothetical protein M0027_09540 [Candidatus Dormibacteraeota bacterium]|nr:hypothetical protein [Candidatus Dormibacteraeota bacterium]